MGYLDELRKQAETRQAEDHAEQELQAQREKFYRTEMLPRLESCYTYLSQMVDHLNYVKPDIEGRYVLKGFGELHGLKQEAYEVKVDSRQNMQQIMLRYVCRGEDNYEFGVHGKKSINRYIDYLRGTGMTFQHRETMDSTHTVTDARFFVKSEIPISVNLTADIARSLVLVGVRNVDDFVSREFQVSPADLDEEFFDKLARFIVREDMEFMRLDIPSETRQALQKKVQEEQLRREQELREAEQAAREQEQAEEQNRGLLQSLKSLSRNRDR